MENNQLNEEKKKAGRKSKSELDNLGSAQILEYPNRTIPKLLEEAIEKGFTVVLAKDGYYIGGFYGLNQDLLGGGFAFAQDTSEANA